MDPDTPIEITDDERFRLEDVFTSEPEGLNAGQIWPLYGDLWMRGFLHRTDGWNKRTRTASRTKLILTEYGQRAIGVA